MQALEALRLVIGADARYSGRLLLLDGMDGHIRTVKLRARRAECTACGDVPATALLDDYEAFCGTRACDRPAPTALLGPDQRMSGRDYRAMIDADVPHVLVDTRQPHHFRLCHLPGALNIPIDWFQSGRAADAVISAAHDTRPIVVLCRRGNDSQIAVRALLASGRMDGRVVKDVVGGLTAWSADIDPLFPMY